jgi:hypothetical protein
MSKQQKPDFESFKWMRGVAADRDITVLQRYVLINLSLYRNGNTGRCDPSYDTIASDIGVDRRSVIRAVAFGVRRGWLAQATRRGPTSNSFAFTFPVNWKPPKPKDRTVQSHQDETVQSHEGAKHRTPQSKRCDSPVQKIGLPSHPNGSLNGRGEREKNISAAPVEASLFKEEGLPTEEQPKKPKPRPDSEQEAAFEEFWRCYPRKVAKDAARRAFVAAGVDRELLIAGAKRYAIERAGEDPKFTKHPATWLNAGCWEDEALGTPVLDEDGNVVAIEQEQEDGGDDFATRFAEFERMAGVSW